MYKYRLLFLLTAVAGIIGGALRSLELLFDFEGDTGLLSYQPVYTYSLLLLSGIMMVCALLVVLFSKKSDDEYSMETLHRPGIAANVLFTLAVLVHGLTSVIIILTSAAYPMLPITDFLGGCLLLLSAFAMTVTVVSLNKMKITSGNSLFLLIPVFWSCFYLIVLFKDVVANANLESYIYQLLSLIFAILSYFSFASYLVSRGSLKKLSFVLANSIYFNTLSFIGVLTHQATTYSRSTTPLSKLIFTDMVYLHTVGSELLVYLGALLFSVAAAVYFSKNERRLIRKLSID